MIDASQLVSNSHQNWALLLKEEVEIPLKEELRELPIIAKAKQEANHLKIRALNQQLRTEEDFAYKMKRKRMNDVAAEQNVSFKMTNQVYAKEKNIAC